MAVGVNIASWESSKNARQCTFQVQNNTPVLGKTTLVELIEGSHFWACLPIVHVVAAIAKFILGGICLYRGETALGFALIGMGIVDLYWPVCLLVHGIATFMEYRRQQQA